MGDHRTFLPPFRPFPTVFLPFLRPFPDLLLNRMTLKNSTHDKY